MCLIGWLKVKNSKISIPNIIGIKSVFRISWGLLFYITQKQNFSEILFPIQWCYNTRTISVAYTGKVRWGILTADIQNEKILNWPNTNKGYTPYWPFQKVRNYFGKYSIYNNNFSSKIYTRAK